MQLFQCKHLAPACHKKGIECQDLAQSLISLLPVSTCESIETQTRSIGAVHEFAYVVMATRNTFAVIGNNIFPVDDLYLLIFADLAGNSWPRLVHGRGMSKSLKKTTALKKKGKTKQKKPSSSWQPTLKHYFGGKVS